MRLRVLVAAALLSAVGCGASPDYKQWQADLESTAGHEVEDFDRVRELFEGGICECDDNTFGYIVALNVDDGTLEEMRVNVRHACPDRLADITDVESGRGP